MPLDPQAQKVVDALAALNLKPFRDSSPAEARESMRSRTAALGPFEEVPAVADHRVPVTGGEITVRVYKPAGMGPHPVLVFYHGGGWVIGDLYTHDGICRSIVNAAGCAVASVDYRLAPEFKYPVPVEDSYAGLLWVVANATRLGLDSARIAVGGDSAGGNLATVVALRARDAGGPPIAFQLLIYPWVDFTDDSPSMREFAADHFLTAEAMAWFADYYLPPSIDRRQPWVSPMHAKLDGLPPAFVLTAECDPLRDQGEAFARRLQAAGVQTSVKRYDGMFHPFFSLAGIIDGAKTAMADASAALKTALTR